MGPVPFDWMINYRVGSFAGTHFCCVSGFAVVLDVYEKGTRTQALIQNLKCMEWTSVDILVEKSKTSMFLFVAPNYTHDISTVCCR